MTEAVNDVAKKFRTIVAGCGYENELHPLSWADEALEGPHRNGYHLVFDTVPAWVCDQCGEAYFEEREVDAIQSAILRLP